MDTIIKSYEIPFYPTDEQRISSELNLKLSDSEQEELAELMRSFIQDIKDEARYQDSLDVSSSRCLGMGTETIVASEYMIKAEIEQELYDEYTSGECWNEYTVIHAFRITRDIFEQKRKVSEKTNVWPLSWLYNRKEIMAAECLETHHHEKGLAIRVNPSKKERWSEDVWWDVSCLYIKDLENVPGYILLIYSHGSGYFH